jgi:hypothetical protein
MKTPEDEAFDELARRQGGGGFPAKRKMAADKLQEQCQKHGECFGGECIYPPAQEPEREALKRIAEKLRRAGASIPAPQVTGTIEGSFVSGLCVALAIVEGEIEALAQPAQEPEMLTIAYQSGYHDGKKAAQRPWVGLTDQESIDVIKKDNNYKYPIQLLQAVMDALKEKNT